MKLKDQLNKFKVQFSEEAIEQALEGIYNFLKKTVKSEFQLCYDARYNAVFFYGKKKDVEKIANRLGHAVFYNDIDGYFTTLIPDFC